MPFPLRPKREPRIRPFLRVLPQYLLPKQLLTQLAGKLAALEGGRYTTAVIRWFIKRYKVDMSEALAPDPAAYKTFNHFFTRSLKPGIRPVSPHGWVCPADGVVSQYGRIHKSIMLQAKGRFFTTSDLLANDETLASRFFDGHYMTIYLSPRDYHRVHMPCNAQIREMAYVPGRLMSVNQTTAENMNHLFALNERVICTFDTQFGPMVMVLVGATIVGSMSTVWHGVVNPPRRRDVERWAYDEVPMYLRRGSQMGQFNLGSTVIMLFPRGMIRFMDDWRLGRAVKVGEQMGDYAGGHWPHHGFEPRDRLGRPPVVY